ncbi:hypothetical protein [Saccharibacillus kuerlensis]|uniref:Uncharacterized protein n=1 Tax=Saccharibacillus kuerlensis TaxID=459527 RepID=A0ABQ2L450_9BACL|nr:hypothetical protein [Saccharibacillus kuerlensis]GGO02005.1 hypothetical protein GCM10010969_24860 [Saccharibacillus kuerlensis]
MNIIKSGACKNSSKNAFVEDFTIRILAASGQEDQEGMTLHWYGEVFEKEPDEIRILHAISHGKIGAANGEVQIGKIIYNAAVIIEFENTKATRVSAIKLYVTH